MKELIPVYFLLAGVAFCVAIAVIIKLRDTKSVVGIPERDFIDTFTDSKKEMLKTTGGGFPYRYYALLLLACPIICGLLTYVLSKDFVAAMLVAFASLLLPDLLIKILAQRQRTLFESRYARALRSMASALRSNMTIQQAVEDTCNNVFIHESIRIGFRQIASDLKVGIPVKDAFERFAKNSGSKDAWDVAAAISMQNEVGGNEAFVVSNISQNINDRIMMRKEIKSLFADTDVMIFVMDIIPVAIIIGLYFYAPQYITPYFEDSLMILLFFGMLAVMLVGTFVIRRMARSAKEG